MTRQCTCGGIIRQHQLTGEREAWTCNACGRYGAIARDGAPESRITPAMWALLEEARRDLERVSAATVVIGAALSQHPIRGDNDD